jgi:hypothetical protein
VTALLRTPERRVAPSPVTTGECILYDRATALPVALVIKAPPELTQRCADLFLRTDFSMGVRRINGLANESQTFGYTQPNALRRRYAPTTSRFAVRDPAGHALLEQAASWYADALTAHLPEIAAAARQITAGVDPQWQLGTSWWTSGIVNKNTPLLYHRDASNHPAWSAMLVTRWGMRGGHLHIADYDITLACDHGHVVYFAGYELVHGVTPFTASLRGAWRYSAVYYPIRFFERAGDFTAALDRGRLRETDMADDLVKRQQAAGFIG